MRFLHLSDLHIGRRLNGFSLLEDQRTVLGQAVKLAEECDAVLLAGDLYDKPQPPAEAIRVVSDFLVALRGLGSPSLPSAGITTRPNRWLIAMSCWAGAECFSLRPLTGRCMAIPCATRTGRCACG